MTFAVTGRLLESSESSEAQEPTEPSLGDVQTAVSELNATAQLDSQKPLFSGELGPFTVVFGDAFPKQAPCEVTRDVQPSADSELYVDAPGVEPPFGGNACEDGTLVGVWGSRWSGGTSQYEIARSYYVGDRPQIWIEAPRDRLVLTQVGGSEALMEVPIPGQEAYSRRELFVLQRIATAHQPGVILHVAGNGELEAMLSLAENVLEND